MGKEPFESCRPWELTATRLCAEMPRAIGAYIQGRGREVAQARFRAITTMCPRRDGRILMNHGIRPSRCDLSKYELLL